MNKALYSGEQATDGCKAAHKLYTSPLDEKKKTIHTQTEIVSTVLEKTKEYAYKSFLFLHLFIALIKKMSSCWNCACAVAPYFSGLALLFGFCILVDIHEAFGKQKSIR